MLGKIAGRRFYVTEKGYMGLATHNADIGDVVVVLLGSNVPFLLRKVDDHYILIGETYGNFGLPFTSLGTFFWANSLASAWLYGRRGYRFT